jgi:hypothetical protein
MSVRAILSRSGTTKMRTGTGSSVDLQHDQADGLVKIKTSAGLVQSLAPSIDPLSSYLVDGAISIVPGVALLTKAGVGAYTLAAPTAAQAGTRITITSGTANAHVVTATGLLEDGVTGGAKNTATFAAFVGASIELIAVGLKWYVVSKNLVTIA